MIAVAQRLSAEAAEFAPGLLSIQESPLPKLPHVIFYTVTVLFALLLAWALFARLDIVAVAEGKLVPVSYTKIVQPAEAGVVAEILVREGDRVREGQTLIRLDKTVAGADGKSLAGEIAMKRLVLRRVDALLANRAIAALADDDVALLAQVQAQANAHRQAFSDSIAQELAVRERAENELKSAQETLTKLQATLPGYEQSAAAHARLVQEGFMSPIAGTDKGREAVEKAQDLKAQAAAVVGLTASITAQDKKLAALASTYRSQLLTERTEAMAQLSRLDQEAAKLGYKTRLLELKAPQDGIVKDIATATRGAVVQPGMVLLTLVPRGEQLMAEVQVRNEDVGFVQVEQRVLLKVAAYPFQKYGLLQGKVQTLAPDAQAPSGTSPQATSQGYKAVVRLDSQALVLGNDRTDRGMPLEAGMVVIAEIKQGHRTVIEYLLSPVQKVVSEAGRER